MRWITAGFKLVLFIIITLFFYSLIILSLVLRIFGVSYHLVRGSLLKNWSKTVSFVLGLRYHVSGELPQPPFFLVSNHLSYVDVFVLFACVRGLFVAKSEVKKWPLIGFIASTVGLLFINRERRRDVSRVNNEISVSLNSQQGIIVFPEGTTSPGYNVLPFKSSLFQYPAEAKIPVYVAAIKYQTSGKDPHAFKSVCWWGDEGFADHFLKFLRLRKINTFVSFGKVNVDIPARKELAEGARSEMLRKFQPTIDEHIFKESNEFTPII